MASKCGNAPRRASNQLKQPKRQDKQTKSPARSNSNNTNTSYKIGDYTIDKVNIYY